MKTNNEEAQMMQVREWKRKSERLDAILKPLWSVPPRPVVYRSNPFQHSACGTKECPYCDR